MTPARGLTPRRLAGVPRFDLKGKPCGNSYIASNLTCRAGRGEITSSSGSAPAEQGGDWRRQAAVTAGITAGALAIGLPAASFLASGSAPGRRASQSVERAARGAASGLRYWRGGPGGWATMPLEMGLTAGAEGIRAARGARSSVEVWRYAPGFAREAAQLGGRKAKSAEARTAYIAQLEAAWEQQRKEPTQRQLAQRAKQVAREQAKSERYARQAAVRMRAARRAARIARTGAPFRESPTPLESFIRTGLANPSPGPRGQLERGGASLTAGLIRQLQSSGKGLGRRRVRFYG